MNKCSICEKEIPDNATECSLACSREASRRFKTGRAADARSTFASAMRQMLQPKPRELQAQLEVPVILVKHRWKRHRSDVAGSVVIGFDGDGIAKIPDVGHNRKNVEIYVRNSKGLASFVTEEPPKVEEPKVEKEKPEPIKVKKPKVEPVVEDNVVTSAKEEAPKVAKKAPKKKPVGPKKKKD